MKYISGPTVTGPQALKAETEKLLNDYNNDFSAWKSDSFLSKFNNSRSTEPVAAPYLGNELMAVAGEVWLASGGAYDPTVGPLVKLWGFGPKKNPHIPSKAEIAQVKKKIGLDKFIVDPLKGTWQKTHPEVEVDVNSIAPGQAADLIGRQLEARGVTSYLIDVGGELLARGERSEGSPWMVGIERPSQTYGEALVATVPLVSGGIATSGSYRNFKDLPTGRISHTLDPRTGEQPSHRTVSVTVIAESAMAADAWATALMVLGPSVLSGESDVAKNIQRRMLKVLLLEARADGTFQEYLNPPMRELLEKK
ncbi:MAG: FAD:protein FMN transferase [Bacteriovoracaceae bacterium]|nr:FAD:protein FMN transferase [Bacteriovoracaceae bacterium]